MFKSTISKPRFIPNISAPLFLPRSSSKIPGLASVWKILFFNTWVNNYSVCIFTVYFVLDLWKDWVRWGKWAGKYKIEYLIYNSRYQWILSQKLSIKSEDKNHLSKLKIFIRKCPFSKFCIKAGYKKCEKLKLKKRQPCCILWHCIFQIPILKVFIN